MFCIISTWPVVYWVTRPMYFTAARVPPENVRAEQTDNQTVRVSWSAIASDQQPYVESDVTYYEVQYWSVGDAVQEPINTTQRVTATSLMVNITYQRNNEMVLASRVCGVTQLRREPVSFGSGPWSEGVYLSPVPPSKPSECGQVIGLSECATSALFSVMMFEECFYSLYILAVFTL